VGPLNPALVNAEWQQAGAAIHKVNQSVNQSINQSINIHLLRQVKMQANNSKQKGNTVSKKKADPENKPEN